MRKGRLTKEEQALRFKLLTELAFVFRYVTRPQLNLYAKTALKLGYPQRLIEYALNTGYLDRYYEPDFKAKIYFLTQKGEDLLYLKEPLIGYYSFEKDRIKETDFARHNLLVDTFFVLNKYMGVTLEKWHSGWLLRRLNKGASAMVPDAVFLTADSKKIAVETVVEDRELLSLRRTTSFYQSEIEKNNKYSGVLAIASCLNRYECLKRYLLAINPDLCLKRFMLTEPKFIEFGVCFYQGRLINLQEAIRLLKEGEPTHGQF